MDYLLSSEGLISLLTLTALEIILGVDNVIFISIITGQLPPAMKKRARVTGLLVAMLVRICLLLALTSIIKLGQIEVFALFNHSFTYKDLILIFGGLFLLGKSSTEIHKKMEEEPLDDIGGKSMSFVKAIVQIVLIDIVFSFDSILTAVGLVDSNYVIIMIIAVVISMLMMIGFSQYISDFIEAHPTFKVLALTFLVLVGFLLVLEGFHEEIPKGYVYFAIAFSFGVELINTRIRKKKKKVE